MGGIVDKVFGVVDSVMGGGGDKPAPAATLIAQDAPTAGRQARGERAGPATRVRPRASSRQESILTINLDDDKIGG